LACVRRRDRASRPLGIQATDPKSVNPVYDRPVITEPKHSAAWRSFVDDYRARCLWFLRSDYYPSTESEWLRVLDSIERHGDVAAFRRASEIRTWLLRASSATSADV
jgi:hypothetical protein